MHWNARLRTKYESLTAETDSWGEGSNPRPESSAHALESPLVSRSGLKTCPRFCLRLRVACFGSRTRLIGGDLRASGRCLIRQQRSVDRDRDNIQKSRVRCETQPSTVEGSVVGGRGCRDAGARKGGKVAITKNGKLAQGLEVRNLRGKRLSDFSLALDPGSPLETGAQARRLCSRVVRSQPDDVGADAGRRTHEGSVQMKDKQPVCPRVRIFESSTFRSTGRASRASRGEGEKKVSSAGQQCHGSLGKNRGVG